jgi:hypothetical protein
MFPTSAFVKYVASIPSTYSLGIGIGSDAALAVPPQPNRSSDQTLISPPDATFCVKVKELTPFEYQACWPLVVKA